MFNADPPTAAPPNHEHLLRWVLRTDDRLLNEIQQQVFLLQTILQNNPAGLAVISGPDLTYQLATSEYRKALPFPQAEILGKPYHVSWPVEQGFSGDRLVREQLNSGHNQVLHLEVLYPDSAPHSVTLHVCPLTWRNEPGALILMQDTTQTQQARRLAVQVAEEARKQANELNAIFTAMAEAVILFDPRGHAIRANEAAVELFGFDPVGMQPLELMDTLDLRDLSGSPVEIHNLPSERARRGETVIAQPLWIESEGRETIVRCTASPIFTDQGITRVITLWHDVTQIEQLVEQLEIEQSRLRTIIEQAPQGIIVFDEEARLVEANPAAERLLGRPLPYQQDYHSLSSLQILADDGLPFAARNLPFISSALDGERFTNLEVLVRQADGSLSNLLVSSAPIVDQKGNLNGAVATLQDITLRKQSEENLRQQASRSRLLANLSQAFAEAGLQFSEILNTVVQQIGSAFGDFCAVNLFAEDGHDQFTAAIYNRASEQSQAWETLRQVRSSAAEGWAGLVLRSGQPHLIHGAAGAQMRELAPAANWDDLTPVPDAFHGLVLPMRAHGSWIGTLNILRYSVTQPFDVNEQVFFTDLAERAALAIEDSRLYEQESRRARELQALNRATTALLSTIDLESLLTQILEAARSATAAQHGCLFLLADDGTLEQRAVSGVQHGAAIDQQIRQYADLAVWEKRAVLLRQINPPDGSANAINARSAIIAPLLLSQRVFGAIALYSSGAHQFNQYNLSLLDSFAATATAALHHATLYKEVQRLATTDTLTEQFNRRKFFEYGEMEIHRYRRLHIPLSVIMFDVDHFKQINDSHGHGTGDAVLRAVAQRCKAGIRAIDILARYGGDEFAILLPNTTLDEAQIIAERILQSVTNRPLRVGDLEIPLSLSLGVAQAQPGMEQLSSLMAFVDGALYQAKQSGRNRVVLAHSTP